MKKKTAVFMGLLLVAAALAGCGSGNSNSNSNSNSTNDSGEIVSESKADADITADSSGQWGEDASGYEDINYDDAAYVEEEYQEAGIGGAEVADMPQSNRKMIRSVDISAETKEFDNTVSAIKEKAAELGGYIESSNIQGGSSEWEDSRYAYIQLKIPANKLNQFISDVKGSINIISESEDTTDVTLEYVDLESRKKTLLASQKSLLALLEKAEKMEDIIKLEKRLTEIQTELEGYESRLRAYDNEVEYSRMSLNLQEIERVSNTSAESMGEEIKRGFSNNINRIKNALRNIAVWFVVALPYLIPLGVLAIAGVIIYKKKRKTS